MCVGAKRIPSQSATVFVERSGAKIGEEFENPPKTCCYRSFFLLFMKFCEADYMFVRTEGVYFINNYKNWQKLYIYYILIILYE